VLTQLPALSLAGVLTWQRALYSTLALLPVAIGMPIGSWLARRMSMRTFDRLILVVLAAIAVKLLWDAAV
jgi:uncharacterized membrane protein YfcA